jgi:cytochrome oxidase Cu insertion factor (SCO1/SenC/PrrC family)
VFNKAYPDLPLTVFLSEENISPQVKFELRKLFTPEEIFHGSGDYINDYFYTLFQEYDILKIKNYRSGELSDQYNFYFTFLPPGKIRDRVLCILLEHDYKKMNNTYQLNELVKANYGSDTSTRYSHFAFDLLKKYGSLYLKGQSAPEFSLTDSDGKIFTLKDLVGKVVFMDFWFKECAPCRALFDNMKILKEKLSNNSSVVFLNISVDPKQKWLDAIKELNLHGYNAYTQGKLQSHSIIKDYKVSGYPTACILDRKGNFFNASPPIYNIKALENQLNEALKQ